MNKNGRVRALKSQLTRFSKNKKVSAPETSTLTWRQKNQYFKFYFLENGSAERFAGEYSCFFNVFQLANVARHAFNPETGAGR